jgi:pimeloyl-ACP methyl ester carboxylesterase
MSGQLASIKSPQHHGMVMLLLLLLHCVCFCFCRSFILMVDATATTSRRSTPLPMACTTFVIKRNNGHVRHCSSKNRRIQLNIVDKRRNSATIMHSSSTVNTPSILREEIRYIAGRRALLLHPTTHPSSMETTPFDKHNNAIANHSHHIHPPLVILGGMAQTISNWEFHLSFLSQHRSVLMYEPLGQGRPPEHNSTPDQYYDDVSLKRQGEDFWKVIDEAFFIPGSQYYQQHTTDDDDDPRTIDVASFSFGGRISLAAATLQPNRIRRLHLTGVGAERDALANVHIACWRDLLSADTTDEVDYTNNHSSRCSSRMRSFAWSIILSTYSKQFLASAGPDRTKTWVESVCQNNTVEGLRAILSQAHDDDNGTERWLNAYRHLSPSKNVESW